MKPSELRALIQESLMEVMSPEQEKQRQDQISGRPQAPELTTQQAQAVVQKFRSLPRERKKAIVAVMRHPCSYCEAELKIPNLGWSHGICERHFLDMYKQMGRTPSKPFSGQTLDIKKTLSPEEIQLAAELFSIARKQGSKF